MNMNKYQPQAVADIVFGNDDSRQLIEDVTSGYLPFPSGGRSGILLFGAYGTGKTTLARLLPAAIERGQTHEDLAAEAEFFNCRQGHTGSDALELVSKQTSVVSFNASKRHYYVFDEVDNLSKSAQAGLKTTLNSPRAAFILTTNNISQLDKGVRDRCWEVETNAATERAFLPIARRIAADENVVLNDEQLLDALAGSNGSFRALEDVVWLAKRTARQNESAASIAAATIQQAAAKK